MSLEVHGTCDPRFESVRRTFAGNLESGADVGASFAVTMNGEMVVDLWGGWADAGKTRPWEADTLVNVYSTTKTMTASPPSSSPTGASSTSTPLSPATGRSSPPTGSPPSPSPT